MVPRQSFVTNTQFLMKIATRVDKMTFEVVSTSHPNYTMYLLCIWLWFPCSHKTLPGLFYHSSETHYVFLATLANQSEVDHFTFIFSVSSLQRHHLCWDTLHLTIFSDDYLCFYNSYIIFKTLHVHIPRRTDILK